ncbi:hypothetical protein [Propioniciclava soli]|uniref:hypothetical protein n=1 Tax=Propioniciclava soli TaxID=2775081 RepID=UPI001E3045D9|nr:hypothetical protein [Propioniciclava soli]
MGFEHVLPHRAVALAGVLSSLVWGTVLWGGPSGVVSLGAGIGLAWALFTVTAGVLLARTREARALPRTFGLLWALLALIAVTLLVAFEPGGFLPVLAGLWFGTLGFLIWALLPAVVASHSFIFGRRTARPEASAETPAPTPAPLG